MTKRQRKQRGGQERAGGKRGRPSAPRRAAGRRTRGKRTRGRRAEPALARAAAAAARTPVREAMTREVVCVRPEMPVEEAAALFLDHGISGAPVVDDAGRPVGVVSKTDVLRCWREERESSGPARDLRVDAIMLPVAFTLPEDAPIGRAAALMAWEGVHRLPIVAADGRVVGIVAALDVLRWLARRDGYAVPPRRGVATEFAEVETISE